MIFGWIFCQKIEGVGFYDIWTREYQFPLNKTITLSIFVQVPKKFASPSSSSLFFIYRVQKFKFDNFLSISLVTTVIKRIPKQQVKKKDLYFDGYPVNIHHRANVGFSAAGLGESWQNCQHLTNNANFLLMIYFWVLVCSICCVKY